MKRTLLAATTVAALTAGTLGATAPAALAKPPVGHDTHGHGSTTHGHGHTTKGDRQLRNAQRQTQHQITSKDDKLATVLSFHGFEVLGADDAAIVGTNIAADRDALAALGEQLAATTTIDEVRAIAEQVKQVRPTTYLLVVNTLRQAADAADDVATIAELTARADALEANGVDVTEVRAQLDAATTALTDAVTAATSAAALAIVLTATSSPADVQAAADAADAAEAAFEDVDAQLDAISDALDALEASAPTTGTDPVTP